MDGWCGENMQDKDAVNEALEARLSQLFASYRAACPDPDASPGFTPALWNRIDQRQSSVVGFRRLAQAIIGAAVLASLFMASYLVRSSSPYYNHTDLEVLASDQNHDLADAEIVQAVHERSK